jgi:hypothetical protein
MWGEGRREKEAQCGNSVLSSTTGEYRRFIGNVGDFKKEIVQSYSSYKVDVVQVVS